MPSDPPSFVRDRVAWYGGKHQQGRESRTQQRFYADPRIRREESEFVVLWLLCVRCLVLGWGGCSLQCSTHGSSRYLHHKRMIPRRLSVDPVLSGMYYPLPPSSASVVALMYEARDPQAFSLARAILCLCGLFPSFCLASKCGILLSCCSTAHRLSRVSWKSATIVG